MKRDMTLLTSILNGIILSAFVPIGILAVLIYTVVGVTLELCSRPYAITFQRLHSAVTGGIANAISVLLIGVVGLGLRNVGIICLAVALAFVSGAIGGVIAATIMIRIEKIIPRLIGQGAGCIQREHLR